MVWTFQYAQSQTNAQLNIVTAIKNGNISYLNETLNISNIDTALNHTNLTPLFVAIETNNKQVIEFLLKLKANPNLRYKGLTPLMYAVKSKSFKTVKLLLKYGATANAADSSGATSLMMAATSNKPAMLKLLLKHGAGLNLRDKVGLTAYDYSVSAGNNKASNFLDKYFESHLPSYFDGPYVRYKSSETIQIQYLKHDSLRKKFSKLSAVYNIKKSDYTFNGFARDTFTYAITYHFDRPPSTYENVNKLVVIGDIHGQCDSLKKFLIANKVTDNNFSWTFGNGHLVFLGDIFDRGEQVTEALWLIYKLENEAEKQGGKVHLLLGNHEFMSLEGDPRYLSKKYEYLYRYFKVDNKKNYSTKTLMGRWIRSKNTMEKINDILFVHGGLHPGILQFHAGPDSINATVSGYLNGKRSKNKPTGMLEFILSEKGPFWYRGMINPKEIQQNFVDSLKHILQVSKIMMGHTYMREIGIFFNKSIYGLDIPFYLHTGVPLQALFIQNSVYYKLNTSGTVEKIE